MLHLIPTGHGSTFENNGERSLLRVSNVSMEQADAKHCTHPLYKLQDNPETKYEKVTLSDFHRAYCT